MIDAHVLGAGYASIQALLDGSLTIRVVDAVGRLLGLVSRADASKRQVEGHPRRCSLAEALSVPLQPFALADIMVETGIGRSSSSMRRAARSSGILSRHELLKIRSARKRAEPDRT